VLAASDLRAQIGLHRDRDAQVTMHLLNDDLANDFPPLAPRLHPQHGKVTHGAGCRRAAFHGLPALGSNPGRGYS